MKGRALSIAATTCLLLAGCGGDAVRSSTPRVAVATGTPGGDSGIPAILDLHNAAVAATVATDTTVPLNPLLYADPGDPCAGMVDTASVAKVDPACGIPFVRLNTKAVPARTLVAQYGGKVIAKTASVAKGLQPASATATANAFLVSSAIRVWAVSLGGSEIIPIIDGFGQTADPLNVALTSKPVKFITTEPCVFPSVVRVVTVTPDVVGYFETIGWPGPSVNAVVATYGPCAGIQVTFQDGTHVSLLGHTQPVSIVTTGHVATTAPFGPIWIEDGWAPCGVAQLKSVCG